MKLTRYGIREWLIILIGGLGLAAVPLFFPWWWLSIPILVVMLALLSFFRDPSVTIPSQRNVMVSPANGVVSSVHEVEHFEPFGEAASCVRVFLSVLDVHVTRMPCYAKIGAITHKKGEYLNAMTPESAEVNTSRLIILQHANNNKPIAAVRMVAGMIARTIVSDLRTGDMRQRGELFGMMKFGSTAEVYIPKSAAPKILVKQGQRVVGGETIIAEITPIYDEDGNDAKHVVAMLDEDAADDTTASA